MSQATRLLRGRLEMSPGAPPAGGKTGCTVAGLRYPVATLAESVDICGIAHALRQRGYGRMRTFRTGRVIVHDSCRVGQGRVKPWWADASRVPHYYSVFACHQSTQRPTAHRGCGLFVPPYKSARQSGLNPVLQQPATVKFLIGYRAVIAYTEVLPDNWIDRILDGVHRTITIDAMECPRMGAAETDGAGIIRSRIRLW